MFNKRLTIKIFNYFQHLKLMYSSKAVPGFFNYMFNAMSDFFVEELSGRVNVDKNLYSNYLATTLMTIIGAWFTHGVRYSPEFIVGFYLDILHQSSTSFKEKYINNRVFI
ncbi:TetR-like C-terminal domain-containing protein [Bacillus sp. AFS031507]|uniref:TetR-like C-terminal domain-containing protein n=1 Tax=Bacillus sp. AFS031507 TaxID=2033496 RepID=UPI00211EA568|nr:TetR-like C-terminal domain-containing protein [Bacillus sp. AFS031507]